MWFPFVPKALHSLMLLFGDCIQILLFSIDPTDLQQPYYLQEHYHKPEELLWCHHSPRPNLHRLLLRPHSARYRDCQLQNQRQVCGWFFCVWIMLLLFFVSKKAKLCVCSVVLWSSMLHPVIGITLWPWRPTLIWAAHKLWSLLLKFLWTKESGWSWRLMGWMETWLPW